MIGEDWWLWTSFARCLFVSRPLADKFWVWSLPYRISNIKNYGTSLEPNCPWFADEKNLLSSVPHQSGPLMLWRHTWISGWIRAQARQLEASARLQSRESIRGSGYFSARPRAPWGRIRAGHLRPRGKLGVRPVNPSPRRHAHREKAGLCTEEWNCPWKYEFQRWISKTESCEPSICNWGNERNRPRWYTWDKVFLITPRSSKLPYYVFLKKIEEIYL